MSSVPVNGRAHCTRLGVLSSSPLLRAWVRGAPVPNTDKRKGRVSSAPSEVRSPRFGAAKFDTLCLRCVNGRRRRSWSVRVACSRVPRVVLDSTAPAFALTYRKVWRSMHALRAAPTERVAQTSHHRSVSVTSWRGAVDQCMTNWSAARLYNCVSSDPGLGACSRRAHPLTARLGFDRPWTLRHVFERSASARETTPNSTIHSSASAVAVSEPGSPALDQLRAAQAGPGSTNLMANEPAFVHATPLGHHIHRRGFDPTVSRTPPARTLGRKRRTLAGTFHVKASMPGTEGMAFSSGTTLEKRMHVRTPLLPSPPISAKARREVLLKMETVQPSGSYKIRGHGLLCSRAASRGVTRFVSSSGGNAGAAVAYAGAKLDVRTTIVVPSTTPEFMQERMREQGAEVVVEGDVWDVADAKARAIVSELPDGEAVHISPFDHPDLWDGHASIVEELVQDLNGEKPSAIVVSVGGGGLFLGVAEGCKRANWGDVPIIAAETVGADSFSAMVNAGNKVVSIPAISSIAKSLGALQVSEKCADWMRRGRTVHSSVVSDRDAVQACVALATHHRVLVEPACGAAVAAAIQDANNLPLGPGPVVVVVCGGNMASVELLGEWMRSTGAEPVEL